MGETIQIMLNSKTANYYNDGTTDCVFLIPQIQLKKNHKAYISVIDAVIPYSFYNVNDTNNVFEYTLNGVDHAITIAKANYNVNTLISYFLMYLEPGFTIVYNGSTNKLTFGHSTYEFSLKNESTCFEILGFTEQTHTSISRVLISDIGINLFTIRNIQISSSNFILNNINTAKPNKASIMISIPVDVNQGSIIQYRNINNIRSLVDEIHNISNLHIQILDQDGDLLDLNGLHYSINLLLTVE
jgi:hypothetical protein